MSRGNRDARYEAQLRLQQERVQERARARSIRRTAVLLSALAVAITAVAVGIALHGGSAHAYDAATDAPTGTVGADRLTIRLGMPAPATLTVYEDPRCAACGRFERDFHAAISRLERQGRLQVDYRILSTVDRHDGGHGSHDAAEALACAQNTGRFSDFHDLLFARRPAESDDAHASQSTLTGLAAQVPGLDAGAVRDCLDHHTYAAWVDAVQADFDRSGRTADPTVLLNGVSAYPSYQGAPSTPAALTAWVDKIDRATP